MKRKSFIKLFASSRRIIIRPYKVSDYKRCRKSDLQRDAKRNDFDEPISIASIESKDKFKENVEKFRKNGKLGHHYVLGVFLNKNAEHIGQVDIFTINNQLQWGNLGYQIQNQFWGNGYATEASKLVLKMSFEDLGFHRIEAATEMKNKASIKVAKKSGMIYEGKRLKFFSDDGGIDMMVYAANAIDYK